MTDRPFRLRVLDGLTDCLAAIAAEEGVYTYTLANAVFRGRNLFGDDDPETMVSILEPPIGEDQLTAGEDGTSSTGAWVLHVQGFVKDDHDNPTDPAHFLMADCKRALILQRQRVYEKGAGQNILGMEGRVTDIKVGSGVVRPPDEVSDKAYFWLPITLGLVEDLDDPFS